MHTYANMQINDSTGHYAKNCTVSKGRREAYHHTIEYCHNEKTDTGRAYTTATTATTRQTGKCGYSSGYLMEARKEKERPK